MTHNSEPKPTTSHYVITALYLWRLKSCDCCSFTGFLDFDSEILSNCKNCKSTVILDCQYLEKPFPKQFDLLCALFWKLYLIVSRSIEQIDCEVSRETFTTQVLPHHSSVFRTIWMNFAKILAPRQKKKKAELHSTRSLSTLALRLVQLQAVVTPSPPSLSMCCCRMEQTAVRIW